MGSQVNFYLVPEDEDSFCRFITSEPDVSILYASRLDSAIAPVKCPLPDAAGPFCGGLAIWNRSIAPEGLIRPPRKVRNVAAPNGIYDIDAFVYPVIEVIRCSLNESGLTPGRVWARFDHSKLNETQQGLFRNWFRRVADWLNKLPYRWDMYRIGPKTKEYFDQGGKAIGYALGEIRSIEQAGDLQIVRRAPEIKSFSPDVEKDDGRNDLTITLDPSDPDHSGFG